MSGCEEKDLKAISQFRMEETAFNDERKIIEAFKGRKQLMDGAAQLLKRCLDQAGATKEGVSGLWASLDPKGAGLLSWKHFCHSMNSMGAHVTDGEMMRLMSVSF
eukprot:1191476-Prorocentrum_minimum.AAC.7